jgi:hypothetical protein
MHAVVCGVALRSPRRNPCRMANWRIAHNRREFLCPNIGCDAQQRNFLPHSFRNIEKTRAWRIASGIDCQGEKRPMRNSFATGESYKLLRIVRQNSGRTEEQRRRDCHCEEREAMKQSLFSGKDCFAEFILSIVEGPAMTPRPYAMRWGFCPIVLNSRENFLRDRSRKYLRQ